MPLQNIGIANPLLADLDGAGHLGKNVGIPCAQVLHTNGSLTSYPAAANTNAAAGTAVMSALAAAVSGDTIYLYRTADVNVSLAKNGITWWIAPGVVLTQTNTSGYGLFDDSAFAGVPISYSVLGHGTLRSVGPGTSINGLPSIVSDQSASPGGEIHVECEAMIYDGTGNATDTGFAAIYQTGQAKLHVNVRGGVKCVKGNCIYWAIGEMHVRAGYLLTDAAAPASISGTVVVNSESPISDFHLEADYIKGFDGIGGIGGADANNRARSWIDCQQLESTGGQLMAISGAHNLYLRAEKLLQSAQVTGKPGVVVNLGAKLYVTTQKWTPFVDSSHAGCEVDDTTVNGTLLIWSCDEYDPSNGAVSAAYLVNAGTAYLSGRKFDLSANTGDGINMAGGAAYVAGFNIVSHSGNFDLKQTGGVLNVATDVRYLDSKTSGAITRGATFGLPSENSQAILAAQIFN